MEYEMENHISLLSVYNNPLFSEFGKPCDNNLKTEDGTEFKVYSEPLSRQSEFFRALFSFDRTFGKSSVIHGIQSDVLEMILVYLYTRHVTLNTGNVMHLLQASDFLLIESLKLECKMFVLENKTYKNCIHLFLTAYQMKDADLEDQCRRFLLICFEKAVNFSKKEACSLPYEYLVQLLRSKSINLSGEHFIWSFIESWVRKNPSSRMQKVPELLRCLSINEIDEKLASDIIASPIIKENELYKTLGDQVAQYAGDSKKSQVVTYCSGVPFITGFRLPRCLYFITKGSPQHWGADMFISYDENLDVWRKLGKTFKPLKILRIGYRVYMFKSNNHGDLLKKGGSIYNLLRGTSIRMAPIPPPIPFMFFYIEAAGHIYALKRSNGAIVYRYVDETNRWVYITAMQPMAITDVVSLNGLIYAIGNIMEERMVMQVYDPFLDSCYAVSPPNVFRDFASSVVYRGKIFLIGGVSEENERNMMEGSRIVEVYDPEWDEWTVYPNLPFSFSSFCTGLVVWKERLYVFKRRVFPRDVRENQPLVAYWDGSGEWKVVDDESSLMYMCVCTIEGEDVVREVMKKNKAAGTPKWKKTGLGEAMSMKSSDEILLKISRSSFST